MESKGILKGASKDWETGKMQITFQLDQDVSTQLENLKGKVLRITAKQWKEKRSLDANAYYWVLVTKLAEALHISKPRCHNLMLRRYGQDERCDGKLIYIMIPDTVAAEETALEAETFHIRPTSQVMTGRGGQSFRAYIMRRGSSTYDTSEMSHLIEGAIDECKAAGIETLPPDELARMLADYEANRRKEVDKNGQ